MNKKTATLKKINDKMYAEIRVIQERMYKKWEDEGEQITEANIKFLHKAMIAHIRKSSPPPPFGLTMRFERDGRYLRPYVVLLHAQSDLDTVSKASADVLISFCHELEGMPVKSNSDIKKLQARIKATRQKMNKILWREGHIDIKIILELAKDRVDGLPTVDFAVVPRAEAINQDIN